MAVSSDFIRTQAKAWSTYRQMALPDHESVNGPGSSLASTEVVREWLPRVLEAYKIQAMLDVPCGDWNWMQHVDLSNVLYGGWDVDAEQISRNVQRYGQTAVRAFEVHNILTEDDIPPVDLILCRDLLQHLPNSAILRVVGKFIASGVPYLITNSYAGAANDITDTPYDSGHTGAWGSEDSLPGYYYRPVNLEAEPFCLPGRIDSVTEAVLHEEAYSEIPQELVLFDLRKSWANT